MSCRVVAASGGFAPPTLRFKGGCSAVELRGQTGRREHGAGREESHCYLRPALFSQHAIGRSGWNCTSIFRVMSPTLLLLSYRPRGGRGWNDGVLEHWGAEALLCMLPALPHFITPSFHCLKWRFREDLHLEPLPSHGSVQDSYTSEAKLVAHPGAAPGFSCFQGRRVRWLSHAR